MKKIFLAAGILAFSFASAQQNIFFDVQEYLKKKNQTTLKKNPVYIMPFRQRAEIINMLKQFPVTDHSYILPNGNKVYLLADNMPCIVPNMKQFNMPNIVNPSEYFKSLSNPNRQPGRMPNAIIPYRIIPE